MHQDVDGHATDGAERGDDPEGVVGGEPEDVLALADDDEGLEDYIVRSITVYCSNYFH